MNEQLHPDAAGRESARGSILNPGLNCWRRESFDRFSLLVDASAYFRAVARAMLECEREIWIMSWDIHSRTRLFHGIPDVPDELGEFLRHLLTEKRDRHVRILNWDFAVVYALEREVLPLFFGNWPRHRRLDFRTDGKHPTGACRHQKLVVIDEKLAFVGGIDLTIRRWDTRAHHSKEARRVGPDGKHYAPFHDIQTVIDGNAAAAIGELFRRRWQLCTGRQLESLSLGGDPWPEPVRPDFEGDAIGIARTEPAWGGSEAVREIETLYIDAVAAASSSIYIENQYFTSDRICEALAERLTSPNGPEIILVVPQNSYGWLETTVMGQRSEALISRLRAADTHGRFRAYQPVIQAGDNPLPIMVHSKLLIVDDRLLRVGTANLCNRSMGLDGECDLVFEAEGTSNQKNVARIRNDLLSEHIGVSTEEVERRLASEGSLIRTIERGSQGPRRLVPIETSPSSELGEKLAPIADPERPVTAERILEEFLPVELEERVDRHLGIVKMGLVVGGLLALAAFWRWAPGADYLRSLASEWIWPWLEASQANLLGPLFALAIFILGGLLMIPVSALIFFTAGWLGPWLGAASSFAGCLLSTAITYAIGRGLLRDTVRRLAGRRLNRLSRQLLEPGLLTVAAIRLLPVAPFTLVNLVAGSARVGFREFFWGTTLALLPGILLISILGDQLAATIRNPKKGSIAVVIAVLLVLLLGVPVVGRWAEKRSQRESGR